MAIMEDEPSDSFIAWCNERGYWPSERELHFAEYMEETTGWDGQQFSLSEAERHWIGKADEVLDWLRVAAAGSKPALEAAFRCLAELQPIPSSLKIE